LQREGELAEKCNGSRKMLIILLVFRGARRKLLRGGLKFLEKYFALTKVQATLFSITFMSYMLFQF